MPVRMKPRGPQRIRKDDGTRVVTIKFRPQEYAKLKCRSLDEDKPLRELVFDAIRHTYGDTTEEEMSRTFGAQPLKMDEKIVDRIAHCWTFSADTVTGYAASSEPAKPSTIPPLKVNVPSMADVVDEFWNMIQD